VSGVDVAPASEGALLVAAIVGWIALAGVAGLFHVDERRIDCSASDEIGRIAAITAMWMWGVFLVGSLVEDGPTPVKPAIFLWVSTVLLMVLYRHITRRVAQTRPWYKQTAIVVGTAADVCRIATILERHPEYGVDVAQTAEMPPPGDTNRLRALIELVEATNVDRVVFASAYSDLDERTGALRILAERGIKVDLVPGDSEMFRSDAEVHFMEGVPVLTLPTTMRSKSSAAAKRAMDIAGAAIGLVVLSPVLAYCAVRIKLDSPGPVFFRQARVGRKGEVFEVYKFRTMTADAEERKTEIAALNKRTDGMFKVIDDPRITKFGGRLRQMSLDELPQLINVLRGSMSLVGPRPLIQSESDLVCDRYRARFLVRPGMTGPWQVLGRSRIPFQDMVKLDFTYVTDWSVSDDIKLLMRTLTSVLYGRGAS